MIQDPSYDADVGNGVGHRLRVHDPAVQDDQVVDLYRNRCKGLPARPPAPFSTLRSGSFSQCLIIVRVPRSGLRGIPYGTTEFRLLRQGNLIG